MLLISDGLQLLWNTNVIKYDIIETRVLSLSEVAYCDTDFGYNIISSRGKCVVPSVQFNHVHSETNSASERPIGEIFQQFREF